MEVVAEEHAASAGLMACDRRRAGQNVGLVRRQCHDRFDGFDQRGHPGLLPRRHEHRPGCEDEWAARFEQGRQSALARLVMNRLLKCVRIHAGAEALCIQTLAVDGTDQVHERACGGNLVGGGQLSYDCHERLLA